MPNCVGGSRHPCFTPFLIGDEPLYDWTVPYMSSWKDNIILRSFEGPPVLTMKAIYWDFAVLGRKPCLWLIIFIRNRTVHRGRFARCNVFNCTRAMTFPAILKRTKKTGCMGHIKLLFAKNNIWEIIKKFVDCL